MQRRTRAACVLVAALACQGIVGRAQDQAENLQVGTWVMNIAKSTFSSGTGFRSASVTITAVAGGVRHTVATVYGDGTARNYEYVTSYDGKDRPVIGNSPWGDTTAVSRVDSHTTRTIYKKDGKVTVVQTSVVSNDGKSRTVTTRGTSPTGQAVENTSFYDRKT